MPSPRQLLQLDSRLSELSRVRPWVESAADRLGFTEEDQFAILLCLEEALANIILHGYRAQPGHPIDLAASVEDGTFRITIDDQAPPFSPLDPQPAPVNGSAGDSSLDSLAPGGNGLRLLNRFAGSLHYERLRAANRLTITFPVPPQKPPDPPPVR